MPESLMARVLKGKYFPSSNFLEAKIHSNVSFSWRSILGVKDILIKGLSRVIGNGRNTRIWSDPWVPRCRDYRVYGRGNEGQEDAPHYVSELVEEGQWKRDVLEQWFNDWEVRAIQNIPLPVHDMNDEWMWRYTKNGQFSVRSAYFITLFEERREHPTTSSGANHGTWKILWRQKILPKIKMFGWKALNNGIAVRGNLAKRGVDIETTCPRCGEGEESLEHMLMFCGESRKSWYLSPLRIEMDQVRCGKFREWVEALAAEKKEDDWWALFWALCWNIWIGRNVWVFEGKRREFVEVVDRAVKGVMEIQLAGVERKKKLRGEAEDVQWKAPQVGAYKLNTDAAIFEGNQIGGGAVVRDHEGDVVVAMCCKMEGGEDAYIAEAMSARMGLRTAMEAGFRNLILEVDNLKLFYHLSKKKWEPTQFGVIAQDILQYAAQCESISFSHTKRQGNEVAHRLAKSCKTLDGLRVWLEEIPPVIASSVIADKTI